MNGIRNITRDGTNESSSFAFTLIELLVVIAILGILASLLVPSVLSSLEKGKLVSCLQNQRSLATAMVLYSADHNGWMPTAGIQNSSLVPELLSYMTSKSKDKASSWVCPADRMIEKRAKLIGFSNNPNENFFYSYGFAEVYVPYCSTDPTCNKDYTQTNSYPIIMTMIQRPAEAVFLADGGFYRIVNNSVTFKHQRVQFRHGRPSSMDGMEVDTRNAFWGSIGYDTKGEFKSAKANITYYDGHSASVTYEEYAGILNSFITSGFCDRPNVTLVPQSEFR